MNIGFRFLANKKWLFSPVLLPGVKVWNQNFSRFVMSQIYYISAQFILPQLITENLQILKFFSTKMKSLFLLLPLIYIQTLSSSPSLFLFLFLPLYIPFLSDKYIFYEESYTKRLWKPMSIVLCCVIGKVFIDIPNGRRVWKKNNLRYIEKPE